MKGFTATLAATASLLFSGIASSKVTDPVTVKGNAFFVGNNRFYIRGVDYQPGGSSNLADPLSNITVCQRDISHMKDLGLNTIRVYTSDNSADHDECMDLLSEAGIYLILDVNTPKFSISRDFPVASYNEVYLQHVFATIDVFSKYTNTLGFFAANEVINAANSTRAATVVKALIRDMRKYIGKHVNRPIPVGYSAADVAENRREMAYYLNCGSDDTRSDFFAFNDYSWCGPSSFVQSGWDKKVENYTGYSIPLFLSEFGCNLVRPRIFNEIKALYSTQMTGVFSGGLVYEFTQEPNNYGLVQIDGDNLTTLPDFDNLKKQYSSTNNPPGDGGYQNNLPASNCPEKSSLWEATNTLPDLPSAASVYMNNGAGTPKGTNGASSQFVPQNHKDYSLPGESGAPAPSSSASADKNKKGVAASGMAGLAAGGLWMGVTVGLGTIAGAMLLF
ncbi:Glucanosyltransferase-domain-containing protein [Tuber borchii]|uniref:1,3-beta-glucanosyltransferase n=1 Tax=Tuber borchii TaxID=42251 RepID=A0A2T6Z9X3_TUBBO|nr:Glucanosyltransferase-domain-containing protein [Tuber borchii]